MAAVQEVAAARFDSLRGHLESRVAAISDRLVALAAKEGKKEAACRELRKEAEALRASAQEECSRRRGLERTLHEAATLFKRELSDKSAEMHKLQSQVRRMRRLSGQQQAFTALSSSPQPGAPQSPAANAPGAWANSSSSGSPGAFDATQAVETLKSSASPLACGCAQHHRSHPGTCCSPGVAAACDVVGSELSKLREARHQYASAVLEQDRVRNAMLSSLGERLSSGARSTSPHHYHHSSHSRRHQEVDPCHRGTTSSAPHRHSHHPLPTSSQHWRLGNRSAAAAAEAGGYEDEDWASVITDDTPSTYTASVTTNIPFASWQDDLSRKLGGVMRKLQL